MVNAKKGDVVILEYTGRLAQSGAVFDTTDAALAQQAGIFDAAASYGPKVAVFGTKTMLLGIETSILKCELGKKQEFPLPPSAAFGEKAPDLIRMLPQKEFLKQGIEPSPGMVVTLDRAIARVKSVTSGRVVVDFNHPLAGEPVIYSIKVLGILTDDQKKIEAILESFHLQGKVEKVGSQYKISVPKGTPAEHVDAAKQTISTILSQAEFREA